ncbi:UDP-N-acetylmuramate dehydrogenase [Clostridium sp. DL1XJH146]
MINKDEIAKKMTEFINMSNVLVDEPMKNHTSFKVGGPADVLVIPSDYKQVEKAIKLCKATNTEFIVIGNGSNLLVKDGGVRGVVIKLTNLDKIEVKENFMTVQGGAPLTKVSKKASEFGLSGLEFACGIPGSMGGAVTMNAGAYGGEISYIIKEVIVLDDNGNILKLNKEELDLGYRTSVILRKKYIMLETTLTLEKKNKYEIALRMQELMKMRKEKQPLEFPSAGSTFKRPTGYYAGKLVQDSGLKGVSVGGAEVSMKHSGFIINKDNATANDILELIKLVQNKVKENFGVDLCTEVRIIGEEIK